MISSPATKKAAGTQARALFDFVGQDQGELTFKFGDTITILQMDGEWWEGELNGRKGLLPNNYVELLN